MTSSGPVRSRRSVYVGLAFFAMCAAALLALILSGTGKADDGQARVGDRFRILQSTDSPGVAVVDPDDLNTASVRDTLRTATPANPVVFTDGPIDTRRIRRSDSVRASRGLAGGSNIRGTWVAPSSSGGVCVLLTLGADESVGGTCSRPGAIDKGSTTVIFGNGGDGLAKGETVFAGAVPDDVTSIQIDLADGTTTTVAVAENTFSFDTTTGIARYRFVTAGGPGESTPVAEDPNA